MANQTLSEDDQQRLLEAFQHVEHEHMGLGTHEKFLGIAGELADRYGVTRAADNRGQTRGRRHAHRRNAPIESCRLAVDIQERGGKMFYGAQSAFGPVVWNIFVRP